MEVHRQFIDQSKRKNNPIQKLILIFTLNTRAMDYIQASVKEGAPCYYPMFLRVSL